MVGRYVPDTRKPNVAFTWRLMPQNALKCPLRTRKITGNWKNIYAKKWRWGRNGTMRCINNLLSITSVFYHVNKMCNHALLHMQLKCRQEREVVTCFKVCCTVHDWPGWDTEWSVNGVNHKPKATVDMITQSCLLQVDNVGKHLPQTTTLKGRKLFSNVEQRGNGKI